MTQNSLTWVIGGAQGSGVDSAANIFSRACAQNGWYVYGKREYYSNIKGEHSYFTVRLSDTQIRSHVDDIDILVSFDADTIFRHADKVTKNGAIIYDSHSINTSIQETQTIDDLASKRISKMLEKSGKALTVQGMLDYAKDREVLLCGIPYLQMLQEFSEKIKEDSSLSKLTRMINVMALSSSMAILDLDIDTLARAIKYVFGAKPRVADLNIAIAHEIYNYTKARFDSSTFRFKIPSIKKHSLSDLILIQGIQSSAIGKIAAGCRFQTYYPITPASDESEFLESNEIIEQTDGKRGSVVVVQTEDEISAISMAIGAALAGTRSATATSGPGFSLMAEALGWAGMNEVPIVITLYQRAGPSTGLPTRHEQGDLQFAIHAGHGEFPRIVFASGDVGESFYDTIKAFNLAEKYQTPVIHMLDKAIANSVMTCKVFDTSKTKIERGTLVSKVADEDEGIAGNNNNNNYLRFKLSDDNPISPRATLGTENAIFWNAGDEHTEDGHISEDPENRINMMDKRMNKLDLALKEIPDEDKAIAYSADNHSGDNDEITIVSWGSTKGAILDAMDKLAAEESGGKKSIKFVQIRLIHPFPTDLVKGMLKDTKVLVDVEMNFSSQLGLLIEQNLHRNIDYRIVKYNGRPISYNEMYDAILRIIDGKAPRRIVLRQGD